MPRRVKNQRQHHFNLDYDDSHQAQLHDHLTLLAQRGKASDWIVDRLLRALGDTALTPHVHGDDMARTRDVHDSDPPAPPDDPPGYMLLGETGNGKSPGEIVRERKAAAAQKFATPKDKA